MWADIVKASGAPSSSPGSNSSSGSSAQSSAGVCVTACRPVQKTNFSAFAEGVVEVLDKWTLLSLAVENGWGGVQGKQKKQALVSQILNLFESGGRKVRAEEFADWLDVKLLTMFSVEAEDESSDEVATLLVEMFRRISEGDVSLCEEVRTHVKANLDLCCSHEPVLGESDIAFTALTSGDIDPIAPPRCEDSSDKAAMEDVAMEGDSDVEI